MSQLFLSVPTVNMRILWFCVLVHCVFAQAGFGTSYLRNSRLCHQWNCLNVKLGLPDSLPPVEQYTKVVQSLLPMEWHDTAKAALDVCYGNRSRRYTNTCPGQALMHCLVDNLIQNCPEEKWRKDDGCAPVSSLAADRYMFSQSRYLNLQKNIEKGIDRRPSWFLQHYFNSKCCEIPPLINTTVLRECKFESFMLYHTHDAQINARLQPSRHVSTPSFDITKRRFVYSNGTHDFFQVGIPPINRVDIRPAINPINRNNPGYGDALKVVGLGNSEDSNTQDSLDCCDFGEFIAPQWRSECDFHLSWSVRDRLTIKESTATLEPITTEAPKQKVNDVKIVPLTCEQETCVFRKLNVVLESGEVDTRALSKLLNNITAVNANWTSAKARVDTKCLGKRVTGYEAECQINKILACTFDILTENCPHVEKDDPCRHTNDLQNNLTCQISSSKFRPRNRRQFCDVPNFVPQSVLKECGLNSIARLEVAPESPTFKKHGWARSKVCKEETPSAVCVMKKMDVLNKYNFIDYFRMKDRIRELEGQGDWTSMQPAYVAAFSSTPLYREHCSSQRKLLNVLDTMLATCPLSKRRQSTECQKMFADLSTSIPYHHTNITTQALGDLLTHFQHIFLPGQLPQLNLRMPSRVVTNPRYDYGILGSEDAPEVKLIDVKPTSLPVRKPLVLIPVYQRIPIYRSSIRNI